MSNLADILRQIKQQIKSLNDQLAVKQGEIDALQAQKDQLVSDRDQLAVYLGTLKP